MADKLKELEAELKDKEDKLKDKEAKIEEREAQIEVLTRGKVKSLGFFRSRFNA